ncbi:MAG: VOC family protein [Deltaproteobacteria bacterium]|nr:VOC family protein [Deltaproteobacteria bacterium]
MSTPRFTLEAHGLARMSHVSLEVSNLEHALAFYRDHLGFDVVMDLELEGQDFETVTGVRGARSRMLRGLVAGNSVVQLFWHSWREPADDKRTLLSFEVRDARAAHASLSALGVFCRSDPVEFDNSLAFVILDPDGHPIEIIQWHPEASPYRVPSTGTRSM